MTTDPMFTPEPTTSSGDPSPAASAASSSSSSGTASPAPTSVTPPVWVCECHGEPYIHEPLVLTFSPEQYNWAWAQAQKMERTYEKSRFSDFEPNPKWTHRGPLAERVLAQHLGIRSTIYHDVGEQKVNAPSDLEYGIELRTTKHPWKPEQYAGLALPLMEKDRKKVPGRKWVLASIKYETSQVVYHGYREGITIPLTKRGKPIEWNDGRGYGPKKRIAVLFPDQLSPMTDVLAHVRTCQREAIL